MSESRAPDVGFEPTVPKLLRRAVDRYADRELIVLPGQRATVAEIEQKSRALAKRLLLSGVGKGTRVGMHFAYGTEFLVAFLATARIGALALPLSTAHAPGEMRRALRRGDVHTLLVPSRLIGRDESAFLEEAVPELDGARGPNVLPDLPHLRQIWVLGQSRRPWAESITLEDDFDVVGDDVLAAVEDDVSPADWLVVISTSGSTAEPKGVIHTHGAVVRKTAGGFAVPIDGPHAIFAAMPLFWIGGLITLTASLANGTTMVCQERFQVDEALDLIEAERCVVVSAWLSVTQALREHPSVSRRDLGAIPALTQPLSERPYGTPLGMTETAGPHLAVPHPVYGMDVPEHLRGSLGVGGPFFDHKLVDPETGEELVGDDVEGEICVRGYAVLTGMYKREREDVFDVDGYYHTGDRVRREAGLYFFTGRVTEMIKAHGANVAPPEVEMVLESLPEVKFAFVVGIPDATRGEQVAGVVVPADGHQIDVGALQERCRTELSSYKVPRVLVVVAENDVPWLATGKPDKLTMKRMLTEEPGESRPP
jgi:acyl-CoA synthetase (AMP-forming)/AMP-acid ligase II